MCFPDCSEHPQALKDSEQRQAPSSSSYPNFGKYDHALLSVNIDHPFDFTVSAELLQIDGPRRRSASCHTSTKEAAAGPGIKLAGVSSPVMQMWEAMLSALQQLPFQLTIGGFSHFVMS